MISAIIYGRNDGYSYEINRRTALGLNQLAAQLDPTRDEIVFVDYYTDDDLPTHAEAIADTLTPQAISLIRVIRVRPAFHASQPADGPPVREAICRNIALRRLNPACKWVLSTNPDCLLITEGAPLHAHIAGLAAGYYGLPRFELPRFVWETLPRSDPARAAAEALALAHALGLEETVRHYLPAIGYDAPGDFQLAPAADLIALTGFDERMTFGWHVDSNMNARLAKRYGALRDLNAAMEEMPGEASGETGGALKLFHAEHARRASAKHGSGRAEDPFETFVEAAEDIPASQADSWGAPEEAFETFPLADPPSRRVLAGLVSQTGAPSAPAPAATTSATTADYIYGPESFDALPRGEELDDHLFAFLFDHLAYLAPHTPIGWLGDDGGRAGRFAARAGAAGLTNPIRIAATAEEITPTLEASEVLILDAGAGEMAETAFVALLRAERARMGAGQPPRRVIGLNVPHSRFEGPFLAHIPAIMTPVATRIRFGEVTALNLSPDLGPTLAADPTSAATSEPAPIDLMAGGVQAEAKFGQAGYVALCRHLHLPPGSWRLDYEVELGLSWKGRAVIDVALDGEAVTDAVLQTGRSGPRTGAMHFESGRDGLFGGGVECRLWADERTRASLTSARLTLIGP